jgi:uncharacterized membrane protein YedE/YeeE
LFLSGFLVGIGTRLGNGCTSGHAVCGIPRFSNRSIVGTIIFMASAIGIATFRYYVPFLREPIRFGENFEKGWEITSIILFSILIILFIVLMIKHYKSGSTLHDLNIFLIGNLFGVGLLISGMTRISKI